MNQRLAILAVCCAILRLAQAVPASALQAADAQADAIWTAIIPDAFPDHIYTWRLVADGTYREDGREALTRKPIQPTLAGRWRRDGAQMILRQDDLPYVFDGVVLGDLYSGTMDFGGRFASRFCARRGEQPPSRCNSQGVAGIAIPKTH